jgi:proteic killer suppression protein
MIRQPDTTALAKYNSLNYEKLKGSKAGLSSVRVNDQYRIEFEEKIVENQTVAIVCNITELSNHYK